MKSVHRKCNTSFPIMSTPNKPVDRFIQDINNANLDLLLSAFGPNAELIDDGKTFKGGEAIKAFCTEALISRKAHLKVLADEDQVGNKKYLHVKMDGDFGDFGI